MNRSYIAIVGMVVLGVMGVMVWAFEEVRKDNLDLPYNAKRGEDDTETIDAQRFMEAVVEGDSIVLVLDQSGSMQLYKKEKYQEREVADFLGRLGNKTLIDMIVFHENHKVWHPQSVPATQENKAGAVAFMRTHGPGARTLISAPVIEALRIIEKTEGKHKTVVVTSDGFPSQSLETRVVCLKKIRESNTSKIKIDARFIKGLREGAYGEWKIGEEFMRKLAKQNGGEFKAVTAR